MPTPPSDQLSLNPTESRRTVLSEVIAERVSYVSGSGTFYVDGTAVTGPRRRTYAEMRTNGLVKGGGEAEPLLLELTRTGEALARAWGLISQ